MPWSRRNSRASDSVEQRSLISVGNPAAAELIGFGLPNYSGATVTESTALTISAVYRAVALISQTIASMPAHTVLATSDGRRERVPSFLDNPGRSSGMTNFEFWEMTLIHLLLHGNAFLAHTVNGAGAKTGLVPIHPLLVSVEVDASVPGGRVYVVTLENGSRRRFTSRDMTHVVGMSSDGIRGLSPISVARNSFGTALAGERAAAKQFSAGCMLSGLVSAEDDMSDEDVQVVRESLSRNLQGWENAGEIAVLNRKVKFTPWEMSAADAQFLESRAFQVEEIARWFGIPPFALMQTEKQTSWGTGIESQQRGLARTVLRPWAVRLEQRLSSLLGAGRELKFDFTALEQADPAAEIHLLIDQVNSGLLTINEARAARNLPPLPDGDAIRLPSGAQPNALPGGNS